MSSPFETLGLRAELVQAVVELGYEEPTPIQTNAIPALLQGRDVSGQAQTGTGKTAAFALPMLQLLDFSAPYIQAIILTPTRELAVQVADAIYSYGKRLNVRVLPIYGGQSYTRQIKRLESGVHVVVGTPGRTLDLIQKGSLDLSRVQYLVLDEADEMLAMGFIEDVESILRQTPGERQTALFSATLPDPIRRLASKYMREPVPVTIAHKTLTVTQTEQRYYLLHEPAKFAALTRLLEIEDITGALIFTRTKIGAATLAENLLARGYPAEALHGDLTQDAREIVLRRFRRGQLTLLVATDVVARGIDIEGISHVINYDIPYDVEDYVHRIGRTGRAGREGVAITLVTPRETRLLRAIEGYTKQTINRAKLPTPQDIEAKRSQRFAVQLDGILRETDLTNTRDFATELAAAGYDIYEIAAAAIHMARANETLRPIESIEEVRERSGSERRAAEKPSIRGEWSRRDDKGFEPGMVRLRLNVGRAHGLRPGDVVGAIAGAAGIPGRAIGAIDIHSDQTFVDVKDEHVDKVLSRMSKVKVLRGQPLSLVRAGDEARYNTATKKRPFGTRSKLKQPSHE